MIDHLGSVKITFKTKLHLMFTVTSKYKLQIKYNINITKTHWKIKCIYQSARIEVEQ